MERIIRYLFLLFLALISVQQNMVAQITIVQSDMPSPGDTIFTSTGLNLDFVDITETGDDYVWDYSQLLPVTQEMKTFVSLLDTPFLYWLFFLSVSNQASPVIGDLPIPNLPITDVFSFYNNSSSNFVDDGFAATLAGIPLPFKYDSPDVLYDFPMNYGNADSSESGFAFGLPDIGYILVDRKRVNYIDGWGTLITPLGTFQVLRQKSEVTEYDSIYIDSLNFGIPVNHSYTEYKWIGKDMKIPILQITDNLDGLFAVYIDSLPGDPVGQVETPGLEYLLVYPNPFSSQLTIQLLVEKPENIKVSIFDMKGVRVENFTKKIDKSGQITLHLNLQDKILESGNYLLEIRAGDEVFTKKVVYKKKY
jgi:hypothetical protein